MKPFYQDELVTLYQGDCLETLAAIDCHAAVTITSPPYWNARDYGGKVEYESYEDYLAFVRKVMAALYGSSDWVVWVAGYIWKDGRMYDCSGDAARQAEAEGFVWRQQVPWVKDDFAPQPSIDLAPAHELIQLLAARSDVASYFDDLRVTRRGAARYGKLATHRAHGGSQRGGGSAGWGGWAEDGKKQAPNVLFVSKLNGAERTGHPAAYPQEVVTPWITACSRPGDVVLDPFAGSGSTLLAAKLAGRRAVGIELNPDYCEIAVKRLAQGVLFGDVA
jgi:site-specific DNA-methyltransferase (adenine-specific)